MPGAERSAARRDERGGGTVLTGCVALCLCFAMVVGVWVAGWVGSLHRARNGADLAALAGAQAHVSGRGALAAAAGVARQNGTTLVDCVVEGERDEMVVRVTVRTELRPRVGGVVRTTTATAVAGTLRGS